MKTTAATDIIRVLPRDLTVDQCTTTKIRAAMDGNDRLVCLALDAADQTGNTPARKAVANAINKQREWLATKLGVKLIDASVSVDTESDTHGTNAP